MINTTGQIDTPKEIHPNPLARNQRPIIRRNQPQKTTSTTITSMLKVYSFFHAILKIETFLKVVLTRFLY